MPGIGSFAEGLSKSLEERRKRKATQEDAIALLRAKAQIEDEFNPEHQAQRQAMASIERIAPLAARQRVGATRAEMEQPNFPAVIAPIEDTERLRQLQSLGLIRGTGSLKPLIWADPNTGQYFDAQGQPVSEVPRGGIVRNLPLTEKNLQTRAAASARGRLSATGMPMEKATGVISAKSALRSLDELRTALADPMALLTRGIPGVPGARSIERLLDNLELEIVTARGGKQLTPSERQLIRQVFPGRLDALAVLLKSDPTVIEDKLRELEMKAQQLIHAVPSPSSDLDEDDLSTYSTEELQAILRGE